MGLIFEKKNSIAYLMLNRPEARNAIDSETVLELISAWETVRDDHDIKCAVITGAGDKAFCTGADLGNLIPLFTGARKPESEAEQQVQKNPFLAQKALLRDFELYKPIIAAINGDAIAGGMELLYSTDIRVACESARFGLQEVKWAIFPMGGSTVKLPRQIPFAKAMEILLTGELFQATEALSMGFINKIVPQQKVLEEAEAYAKTIVKNGPLAVTAIKKAVLNNIGLTLKEGLSKEFEIAIPVFLSKDAQEGPKAFKEKREPIFQGK
ncbi:MAG: enoyl-CoA hydratase/isomerase family protein [Desulfobacterales bacterium]|nr:enoyl-CoA hydratase/isomerase family protein [Desulfobacterales bacterium]